MIFKVFLNCFFPSFNSKIEISKIETWVICEHTTHKHTHQQAQPNTQTHPPKTKTLISGVRYSDTVYNKDTKKKKKKLL